MGGLTHGCVRVLFENQYHQFDSGKPYLSGPVELHIHHASFFKRALLGGTVGAAESYMLGEWSTPNLPQVVRLMVKNRATMERMDKGWFKWSNYLNSLLHAFRKNTVSGSKKNIVAHYDLGNRFFELFLDQSMQYSSAVFKTPQQSLEDASRNKMETICQKLQLKPEHHVLEIGSGWGELACYMASTRGCRVTTTTISEEQYVLTCQKVRERNLEDRVEVLKKDYRHLEGTYDHLVSIEMIEAVGHHYLDTYLKTCMNRLKPSGRFLLQVITIRDHLYDSAVNSVDFIKKYIFPGSFIPCISAVMASVQKQTDFRMQDMQDLTPHYAKTIDHWRQRFLSKMVAVEELGYSIPFIRMWDFYLAYCQGGFEEESIGCAQLLLARPEAHQTIETTTNRS